jgi:tetratricopeptide (TPR) repeat protein
VKRPILAAAIAFILVDATPSHAQLSGGPIHTASGRGGVAMGGTHYSRGPGYGRGGFAWGYSSRIPFAPFGGFPFFPFAPLDWSGFLGPSELAAPQSGIQIVLPPIILNGGSNYNSDVNPPPRLLPQAANDDLPRGAKPGDHFVIRPNKGLPLLPPPEPVPLVPPVPRPPLGGVDPFAPRKMVNVDKPDPDPVKEIARLMKLGKTAFAAEEFGAASEHFDRAIATDPKLALPVFLKAQSAFAAGRYADAVTAIRAGLELDRTWPTSPFDPKELYGANPALFADHLATLRGVVAANPGEATLEFLLGYELWFIGEKVEAKKWFDLAEKRLPAPGPITLFK